MKNRLKKMLSILLAVVMAAGVFTVLPPAAGAEETVTDEKSLLLGDVDGDGEVTVIDATFIQRWLFPYLQSTISASPSQKFT